MTDWTEEGRLPELQALAAKGLSASMIAREMRLPSRSAVIGAAYRHGVALNGNNNQGERERKPRKPRSRGKPSKPMSFQVGPPTDPTPVVPAQESSVASGEPASIVDVKGCLWPISGEGYATLFCNGKKTRGPYCAHHWRISVTRYVDPRRG